MVMLVLSCTVQSLDLKYRLVQYISRATDLAHAVVKKMTPSDVAFAVSPHRKRLAARREAFLAAAKEVFQKKGFAEATLDDVIAVSGGSRQTLYELFGGKQGLFEAIISETCETIFRGLTSGAASHSGTRRGPARGRHPLSCHRDLAGVFEPQPPYCCRSAAYSGGCPAILEARPRPQPRLPGRIFRPPDRARAASDARQPRRSGIFPRDAVGNRAAAMPHWLAPAANAAGNRRDRPRCRCSVPERLFGSSRSVAHYCSAAYNFLNKTTCCEQVCYISAS